MHPNQLVCAAPTILTKQTSWLHCGSYFAHAGRLAVMGGVMIVQACCEMRKMPVVRCAAALTDAYLPLLPLACTSQRAARDKEDQERLRTSAAQETELGRECGQRACLLAFSKPFLVAHCHIHPHTYFFLLASPTS